MSVNPSQALAHQLVDIDERQHVLIRQGWRLRQLSKEGEGRPATVYVVSGFSRTEIPAYVVPDALNEGEP